MENLRLREYRAVVPDNYKHEGDAVLFLNGMIPNIVTILHDELVRQASVKYSLVLTAELDKMNLSVGQEYDDNALPDNITTTAYFRNEAKPVLNI